MQRSFGTIVIRSVSNFLQDLLYLEAFLNEAIQQTTDGEIRRIP